MCLGCLFPRSAAICPAASISSQHGEWRFYTCCKSIMIFRILGYCAGTFCAVWYPLKGKLLLSLSLTVYRRILAPVAHFAGNLVPRIHLYPAGRKPKRKKQNVCQSVHRFSGYRYLAWSGLELYSLGCNQRCVLCAGTNEQE